MNRDMAMNTNMCMDEDICICIGVYAHESAKNGDMTCKQLYFANETQQDRVVIQVRFNIVIEQEKESIGRRN